MIVSISPNPYITRKLNNMDKIQAFKNKQDNQTRIYYKMLKGIETIIDVQKQVQDMMKIVEEVNMTIMEMEETILKASINNQTMNTMNILEILEDLQYLIQSNMEDRAYQVQRMLADELDTYKGQGNKYVNDNIQEIQELYKDKKQRRESNEERVENEKVILIKPYKISESTLSTIKLSFIDNEVENLMKYIKYIQTPI